MNDKLSPTDTAGVTAVKRTPLTVIRTYFSNNLGIFIAFISLFVVLSITAPNFFTIDNILNVLRQITTNSFLSIGVMLAIVIAGIDLTGGSMLALTGCICVEMITFGGIPIWIAVLVSCLVGVGVGFINGGIITYTGIHPFIVTLAMQSICRGAAYLVANGQPVTITNKDFDNIGNGYLGPIPLPVIYMTIFLLLDYFLLNRTKMGRYIFAVGGNRTAAQYSGINIHKVEILVYTVSGLLAAFGGVVLASRMSSGQPSVGIGFETDAVAAAALGGTSMYGGIGTVGGMILGLFVLGIINNGLNLLHVNSFWQYVVKGILIIIAVYVDMYRKRKDVKVGVTL